MKSFNAEDASFDAHNRSPADVAIITMQDILGLDAKARMNVPSEASGNWQWRLTLNWVFFDDTAEWIKKITKTYGRCE